MSPVELSRIGRYEIITMLGEGGMARVYLAASRGPIGFSKLVVVKQVRPELAWDREFLTMFFDEARLAARLNHPNVVQTYEVIEDTGHYLLAMEYLEGQTLSDTLRRMGRANVPLEEHLFILTQILGGLQYAHELCDYDGTPLGVVHRDVSPSNVFITYNGEVKLLDFGIAKAAGAISATQKGMVKGKIGYGAPEQFMGEQVDRRADIFSVGIMLWEALARKRRKLADTPAASFQALLGGHQPKIRDIDPDVPPRLAEICDRAVATDPNERYGSALDMLADLEAYVDRHMRRVERREIAVLMSRYFNGDRQDMRKRIEERLGVLRTDASPESPVASVSSSRAPTVVDLLRQRLSTGAPSSPDFKPAWLAALTQDKRIMIGAAAAFGLVAAMAVGSRMKARPSAPAAPPAAAAEQVVQLRPVPVTSGSDDKKPAETIRFSVKAEPASATLLLDGKKLSGNPFQADPSRDSRAHLLRVSAPGYFPVERSVNFSRDLNLIISLRPVPPAPPARISKRADDSEPAPAPRAEPKELEPGADLQKQDAPRAGRRIDEKDPYGR
jgi:serine/threonine-protein kinase